MNLNHVTSNYKLHTFYSINSFTFTCFIEGRPGRIISVTSFWPPNPFWRPFVFILEREFVSSLVRIKGETTAVIDQIAAKHPFPPELCSPCGLCTFTSPPPSLSLSLAPHSASADPSRGLVSWVTLFAKWSCLSLCREGCSLSPTRPPSTRAASRRW